MISKKLSLKLKIGKMNCFIPCRKKGDKIDNLNFLELEGKKLVEYSIIVAMESKLFDKIFVISDDKSTAKKLMIKYPKLIERPIVISGNKGVIARPLENLMGFIGKH